MVLFWILVAGMMLVALGVVLIPLLRSRGEPAGPSARAATLEVLRGQRREVEADIAAGTLPAEAREEVLAELVERAGTDLPPEPAANPAARVGKPWIAVAIVAVAVPAMSLGLYSAIGTPAAADPRVLQAARDQVPQKELVGMIENLARKVRERPDDARGWELLARSMMSIGRFGEAVEAYEHLARLMPTEAQVYADWADALAMAQGRSLRGRPRELAERALALDPKHDKALALAATAAMDAGDYAASMALWARLAEVLPPDSPDVPQLRAVMEEVRELSGGKVAIPAQVAQGAAPAKSGAASGAISGSVALAPSIAARVKGDEHLFVFARADGGPRIPLAVVRVRADALPYEFALDDSQAMAPGMNISSASAVRIEARISRSGDARAQSGDLFGTSEVVKAGARGVKVLVDQVVP